MSQLARLAEKFTGRWVSTKPGKGNPQYVEHAVINQRLLQVLGPHSFEIVQALDGHTVLGRLTVNIDGVPVVITEVGASDNQSDPYKSAASDAYKRCAMRIGCGLHLWAQDLYFLDQVLVKADGDA